MVVADIVTPRMSNQVRHRAGKEAYEQLNAFCPKCKSPLVRRTIQGNLLASNFSFGLISASQDDSFTKAVEQPGGSRQRTPTERFLCFTSTELTSSAEEDSSPFDCCSIARAQKFEKKLDDSSPSGSDNGEQESLGRGLEEGNDDGITKKNDIRSELSFCVTCQAYVATERVISEHQQALSELVDRLAVDDEGTAFMNLYVANDSEIFEEASKTPIDLLSVLKEDRDFGKRNHENEVDDPSGLSTVITSNIKSAGEPNVNTNVAKDQKSANEAEIIGKTRVVPGQLESSIKPSDATKRREIIAEALGRKLLEGFSVTTKLCKTCGVPLMQKSGIVSCFACPALQRYGVANTLKSRPHELIRPHQESDGTQGKPQLLSGSFKEPKFGTRADDCSLPNDESKPMFPYPQNAMKYEFNDTQRYQRKISDGGVQVADATQHPYISQFLRLKYADCKYCGLPCFDMDNQGECKECRAVLSNNGTSTEMNTVSKPSFSQTHSLQVPKVEKLNSIVGPTEKLDNGRELKESRGEKISYKERDEVNVKREAFRQHKTEQPQKNVYKLKSEKKVLKKIHQKPASRSSFEKLAADDLHESGQHLWWVEAISVEDSKLESISVPLNTSSFDGSLNSHSLGSYNEKIQEEESKNEGNFEVLDGTKPWNSISSESFESGSIRQSNIMEFIEKKDRPIIDVYAPIDITSQTSLSLETKQKSPIGLMERLNSKEQKFQYTQDPDVLKKSYTDYVREVKGYIPPSDFLPVNVPTIDNGGVKHFEEPNKFEALQESSRIPPSLNTVDNLSSNERTSAVICRLLGCGWKLASDVNCRKCLMPMMRKIDVNVLMCASCDVDTNQILDPLPYLKKHDYEEIQASKTSSLSLSRWNVSGTKMHPSPPSPALSKLRIGKKLLENWSFVTSRTCDECSGPIMRAPSTQNESCINSKCRCSNLNVNDPPKAKMTEIKQAKNIRMLTSSSNYSTATPPMSTNGESETQICDSGAAKLVPGGKKESIDSYLSTEDNYSRRKALGRLQKKYLQYTDNISTETIHFGESGETNIERKLQAQLNIAELLGSQKSQLIETDIFSAEFNETVMSKEVEVNIENKLEEQMKMADFLWTLHKP